MSETDQSPLASSPDRKPTPDRKSGPASDPAGEPGAHRLNVANGGDGTGGNGDVEAPQDEPGGWFNALKSRLGLGAPSLREILEEAVRDHSGEPSPFTSLERDMLARTLRFGTLRVEDVMVPRADIVAIEESAPLGQLLAVFRQAGHSRIPIYTETLDDLRGMVHFKDFLRWLTMDANKAAGARNRARPAGKRNGESAAACLASIDPGKLDLTRSIASATMKRDVLFVPPSMSAVNLLLRMQSTHIHLAMVVDEYGGTEGLVSIEDLIEEVVGEIEDEHDENVDQMIERDPVLGVVASARTPIEDLESYLGCELRPPDDDEDIDTLGGLIFALLGQVPVRGEVVPHASGFEFEILDADPRRIKRVRILLPRAATAGPATPGT